MTNRDLVDAYVQAVSDGDFNALNGLVHPDSSFDGTVVKQARGAEAFVQGFRTLRPITLRIDVRAVVIEGDQAAVMYDLVTDTAVGSVLCSEFLTVDGGLIKSSTLIFDWRRWPEVIDELRRRISVPVK